MNITLLDCLLIEPDQFVGKHIHFNEIHGSDASWALCSLIADRINRGENACLIIFHHTFGHFHNCCIRLGINLKLLEKQKRVTIIEGTKLILKMQNETNKNLLNILWKNTQDALLTFVDTKETQTFIVLDDVSSLLDIGCTLSEIMHFIGYYRLLIFKMPKMSLITGAHISDDITKILANGLIYQSNAALSITPLKTGPSRQVHGRIEINRQGSHNESRPKENVTILNLYHFQIKDQEIKIFAPGSILAR